MTTEQIRQGLRDFRTRASTMDRVAGAGPTMIDAVLPLLHDRHDGVRWAAIRIMTEIGDERAVGPLTTLLQQSKNRTDVQNALRAITGENLDGLDAWRSLGGGGSETGEAAKATLSDEELVRAAVDGLSARLEGGDSGFHVMVDLPGGRSQHVYVDFSQTDPGGQPIVQLSTPCGPADPARYESVLKLNMSIPYGAIALAALDDDHLCFAMVDSYQRSTVHPEDLAGAIQSLAEHGDEVEQSLTGDADEY